MARRADAEGVTVLAVAEEALACVYQRSGFVVQERAAMSWGTAVLLVRKRLMPASQARRRAASALNGARSRGDRR